MPNYDNRKYRAEEARREAEEIQRNYPMTPRTLAVVTNLTHMANSLDEMNDREERRYERDVNPSHRYNEMDRHYNEHYARQRENPGRYNPQDYPRNDMEYKRYESEYRYNPHYTHSYSEGETNPKNNFYPSPYPYIGPMYAKEHENKGQQKMGFAAPSSSKHSELFKDLEEYYSDYMKHKKMYEESSDPTEKNHMLMELKEFASYLEELYHKIASKANTPEEKQYLQQAVQKMQQTK